MVINIDSEYEGNLSFSNEFCDIIRDIIQYSCDFVKCPYETEVNVLITDNEGIRIINKENRDIDKPTDVLSFPMLDYNEPADFSLAEDNTYDYFDAETGNLLLGDIVISLDKVYSQAEEYGHSPKREIAFLTAHSMLHLFGYDHMEEEERKVMEELQEEILTQKGYSRDYE
ncbi:probable rRNA maturation factor [Eubacterium ruminantium]|nr:probable rRNA maturation factor [Eubacterium ruminantium]